MESKSNVVHSVSDSSPEARVDGAAPQIDLDLAAEDGRVATDQFGNSLVDLDPVIEGKIRRKIDLCIIPIIALLYLFCFIDRANIGNARLAGLEKDLGLKGNDYNMVLSVFFIGYIVFEMPSVFACKLFGPGWYIPGMTLAFGAMTVATSFCNTKAHICAVRFILGAFEAGMLPGIAYFLSRWYRRNELAFRLAMYIVMAPLAGAFGGLLASAILSLDSFGGLHRWRMLFAIEGIITCGLAIIAFFTLTDRPETANWLTPYEKKIAVARIKSERIGTTEILDSFTQSKIWRGILNPVALSTALMFGLGNITSQGLAFFTPTIISSLYPGETVVIQQLRTVPQYVVGAFFTLGLPYLSWKTGRFLIFYIAALPFTIAGYIVFLAADSHNVRYGSTFLITVSAYCFGALSNALISANVISDTSRSAAIGMNSVAGNIGGLISTWSYLPADKPTYPIGNGLNLGAAVVRLIIAAVLLWWLKADNKRREAKQQDSVDNDLDTKEMQDKDWKNPAFRWRP